MARQRAGNGRRRRRTGRLQDHPDHGTRRYDAGAVQGKCKSGEDAGDVGVGGIDG